MVKKEVKTESQTGKVAPRDQQVENKLLELREEYRKLHEKKIATERDRQNLEERLRELREQAERDYGTSDLEQLRQLLEQRRQENERMVTDYEQHVREINERLGEIESAVKEGP
jgi:DNA anti-recombination protein RmuC